MIKFSPNYFVKIAEEKLPWKFDRRWCSLNNEEMVRAFTTAWQSAAEYFGIKVTIVPSVDGEASVEYLWVDTEEDLTLFLLKYPELSKAIL